LAKSFVKWPDSFSLAYNQQAYLNIHFYFMLWVKNGCRGLGWEYEHLVSQIEIKIRTRDKNKRVIFYRANLDKILSK
jgi:hypothetical protein